MKIHHEFIAVRDKNRLELQLLNDEIGAAKNHLRQLLENNSEIVAAKKQLHELSEKAELLRVRVRAAEERSNGKRDDNERMRLKNEKSKATATLHCSRWCDVDDAFLMENKGKITLMEIANKLGRTRKSVKSRIYKNRELEPL